jgi:hypothetical protein
MRASVADQVIFRFSRWKHIGGAVTGLLAIAFFAYPIVFSRRPVPWFVQAVGIICVASLGVAVFLIVAQLFDRRPALVLDRQGLIDCASYSGVRRIDWTMVRGIRTVRMLMFRYLVVDVYDPRQFVDRGNVLMRMLWATNAWLVGSPIALSSIALDTNFDQMARVVGEFFEQAKAAGKPPLSSGSGGV